MDHRKIFTGHTEKRYISTIKVNSDILKNILNTVVPPMHITTPSLLWGESKHKISFNLMIITTDNKVLLLERTQSFHFPKVVKDLKNCKINFRLLDTLYHSEIEKIRKLFFDFLPPLTNFEPKFRLKNSSVRIFPGGHSMRGESIVLTLLRELYEEIGYSFPIDELKFNQSCVFKVLIYDLIVKKTFNNFVFPVKVEVMSNCILQCFKETKHTRNPTFIDISKCTSLFDAFVKVQEYMLI
ncbi:hypothetical protein IIV25_138R [Invertebrate iridovirus 25]|uniref:Nudix hydrolase domain-containing protein n=1 Tax=Invertebrate iridovirus 25 TaxID=1301280 RepID=W8W238_9VIRU|nr:hypothetical protein IIV25_138R [Invertebrate iridovirus 25]CCV02156.1 hypothetical protein IIV25_138R [Invertebrate iridovirus 25]